MKKKDGFKPCKNCPSPGKCNQAKTCLMKKGKKY